MSGMETGTESCPVMGDCSIWDTELFVLLVEVNAIFFTKVTDVLGRSHWPRGLRLRSCGRSPAEIVGSNPMGGGHGFLS